MTYVLSDIHGRMDYFQDILDQINLREEDKLYVLGDAIDRNPDGLQILLMLIEMPNVIFLLGNHEHMMMDVLEKYNILTAIGRWYRNGGEVTHDLWLEFSEAEQKKIIQYIKKAKINETVQVGDKTFFLVHAAPAACWDGNQSIYRDAKMFAVWERLEGRYPFEEDDDRIVIFGHTPTLFFDSTHPFKIWHGDRMIGIDCGAGYPEGRLACLRLEDMKEFYSDMKKGRCS